MCKFYLKCSNVKYIVLAYYRERRAKHDVLQVWLDGFSLVSNNVECTEKSLTKYQAILRRTQSDTFISVLLCQLAQ